MLQYMQGNIIKDCFELKPLNVLLSFKFSANVDNLVHRIGEITMTKRKVLARRENVRFWGAET